MPIYEFACRECGEAFEKLVRSASSSEVIRCPSCQSEQVKKKLSTFASGASRSGSSASSSASCSTGGL